MNVLVLGARIIGSALAFELAHAFVGATFQAKEERFERRFKKVLAIEAKYMRGDGAKKRRKARGASGGLCLTSCSGGEIRSSFA